jgi:hypothetical protein
MEVDQFEKYPEQEKPTIMNVMRPFRLSKEAVEWGNVIWRLLGWLGLASIVSGIVVARQHR